MLHALGAVPALADSGMPGLCAVEGDEAEGRAEHTVAGRPVPVGVHGGNALDLIFGDALGRR